MRNTRMPARAAAVAAAALAVSALSFAPPAISAVGQANAANGDVEITTEMRLALQRDLGMMPARIPQYFRAEKRMPEAERKARSAFGARYAGSWLERNRDGEYEPVVAVAGAREAVNAGALGARVRVVAHSLAQLQTTQSRLDGAAKALRAAGRGRKLDPSIHSWHVDPISNRVVVTTDRGARSAAIDFVAASGADANTVRFVESDFRPQLAQQATFDIRGGDFYRLPNFSACSIGFAATLGDANGFITAGHCGTDNLTVVNSAGQSLGYIFDSVYPGNDFAVVHNTNPSGIPRPWANAYAFGGNLNIRGTMPAAIGAAICRSGFRTGAHCGTLLATGVTVSYGDDLVFNLSSTSVCVGQGDSGGPFATPDGQAQGVTSGGRFAPDTTENCTTPFPPIGHSSLYQPLQPILDAYPGLTLVLAP